jgi:predicted phosphodiesterase
MTGSLRLAILSDIHGNIWALEAALARVRALGDIDRLVIAGDLLSGPLEPSETADVLRTLDAVVIRGNHERQLLACAESPGGASDQFAFEHTTDAQRRWIGSLPATLELAPEVLVCHGTPESDLVYLCEAIEGGPLRLAPDDVIATRLGGARHALILCGHSHLPRTVRLSTGQLVVNAGSVGLQAYIGEHPAPHLVENGSPHARFVVCERTQQGWQAEQHQVAHDWESASRTAARHGRPDWARWLAAGRV